MTARALRLALAVSVFVNLFAVGTIAGGLVAITRDSPRGVPISPRMPGRPIRSAAQDLPPAEQALFREAMRQALDSSRDLARAARADRREAAALFTQPQFDRDAAAALLEHARQADLALRGRLENAAIDFAATLPANQRATLAIGLERRGPLRGARP